MPFSTEYLKGILLFQNPEEKQKLNTKTLCRSVETNKKKFYFENTVFKDKFGFHFPYLDASNKIQKQQNKTTKQRPTTLCTEL